MNLTSNRKRTIDLNAKINVMRGFRSRPIRGILLLWCSLLALAPMKGEAAVLTGNFLMHDPSRILKSNGKYFIYGTGPGIIARTSIDLVHWTEAPPVLKVIPAWAHQAVPRADSEFAWAPDVVFLNNKYFLFYSFSTFGSKVSVIGLLTNSTLDPASPNYNWKDEGLVIASSNQTDFNAIDPALTLDAQGDLWMSFGSFFKGGIQLVKLDRNTAKPIGKPFAIAAGHPIGPEAPYIHYRDGYYYLFINEAFCCRGMNSTYTILIGRSKTITGPYLDKQGKDLAKGGGTLFLGTDAERIGPGHVGVLSEGGIDRFTFHYYDGRANGVPTLGMQTLLWDANGWPRPGTDLPGGRYVIVSKASGLALGIHKADTADGTPIDQFEYKGGAMQQWNISSTGDGYYSIGSLGTGKYFDLLECSLKDGTKISQYPWFNNDCQKWRIEQTSESTYRIVSKGGSVLTLPGGVKTPQALVQGYSWKGDSSQQWLFQKP